MLVAIVLTAIGCSGERASKLPASGTDTIRVAPSIDFKDIDGKEWKSRDLAEQTVLIEFWATWCVPCREIAPELHSFHKRTKHRVTLLSLSLDESRGEVEEYQAKHPFPNPVVHAGPNTAKEWGVAQIPALVLVRKGKVVFQWAGKESVLQGLRAIEADLANN